MKLYNSLSKKKEVFKSIVPHKVSMYHCGPTVYDYVHIGNLRSFLLADVVRRSFEFLDYEVQQVMNITDVGHLVSDGDDGDDKMTKALKRIGKEISTENMIAVAETYTQAFVTDLNELNILLPHHFPRASDHIPEDITLIKHLEEKGYTYATSDGIYFDTSEMKHYGALGGTTLDEESDSRILVNNEKKHSADFALWKFDNTNGWKSPWGQGFPGWHIECSAMATKYLGSQFDIHTGGIDLKSIHHNNEIAQSECATGCSPFVNYWVHGEMLNFKGGKLSKSTGGTIGLHMLKEKGFDALSYRYLTLQTHYRSPMNFSWDTLESAQVALNRIQKYILELKKKNDSRATPDLGYVKQFTQKIEDDINLPQALAVFHEVIKSDIASGSKLATLLHFDAVLGLDLDSYKEESIIIPQEIQLLLTQRKKVRERKDWSESDRIRDEINNQGFEILDEGEEQRIVRK